MYTLCGLYEYINKNYIAPSIRELLFLYRFSLDEAAECNKQITLFTFHIFKIEGIARHFDDYKVYIKCFCLLRNLSNNVTSVIIMYFVTSKPSFTIISDFWFWNEMSLG
jgi:hypothetical protein